MAQVSLRINGYGYILGCADGEEHHLLGLAADLDQRIEAIKASAGPSGEARLLLMAALVLSDELHDLRQQMAEGGGQDGGEGTAGKSAAKPDAKAARRLSRLARRAETIADQGEIPEVAPAAAMEPEPLAGHVPPPEPSPE